MGRIGGSMRGNEGVKERQEDVRRKGNAAEHGA